MYVYLCNGANDLISYALKIKAASAKKFFHIEHRSGIHFFLSLCSGSENRAGSRKFDRY